MSFYEDPKGSMATLQAQEAPSGPGVVIVPLAELDGLAGNDSVTFGYVVKTQDKKFAVEGGKLDKAVGSVITKWRLLAGRMAVNRNTKIWCLRVPTGPFAAGYKTHTFTHYPESKSLTSMPFQYSSVRLHSRPPVDTFRLDSTPDSLSSYGTAQLPLITIATSTYANCVAIGISFPDGVLGVNGIKQFLTFLDAELNDLPWEAPKLSVRVNPLAESLEALQQMDLKEQPNLPLPARDLVKGTWTNWFFLLLGIFFEFVFKRAKAKALFFPEELAERMAERVKGEVRVDSSGQEWVSTGDALFAWFLHSCLAGESSKSLIASHSLMSLSHSFSNLESYSHNTSIPSYFPTIPKSSLNSMPIFVLALLHRRTLTSSRLPIYISKALPLVLANSNPVPYRRFNRTNFVFSNLTHLPVMSFGAGVTVEQEYYYESPWEVDNKIVMRKVEGGYLFEGIMRSSRWQTVASELARLEIGSTVTSPRLN